ncbi:hypothetical protein [Streptomyces collinus]|uniref:Uncharacterized protein n=1 Tax=Streptomyces collinus TaxID=42684 RepID=A0AA89TG71_STRCU|nr:hypothetical protein [Streptomyces collinus]MBB5811721.1 hypothetical protein [Streptomyces collinus]WMX64931.1 hypothetical protein RFN52_16790 [Streptomyces collinus]
MNAFLTAAAFVVLIAAAAYVIHRLDLQHADRIAAYRYSTPRPGRRGHGTPQPHHAPRVIIRAPRRPLGRASEPSAQSAATRARGVHPGPGQREERPGPVDGGI